MNNKNRVLQAVGRAGKRNVCRVMMLAASLHYSIISPSLRNNEVISFSSSPIMTKTISFISIWMCFLNQTCGVHLVSKL